MKSIRLLLFLVIFGITCCCSQKQKKDYSWDELSSMYKVPEWFTQARFGIWVHWGPQSVPEYGGGWYERHMYMQNVGNQTFGENAYPYHVKTFGPQCKLGYKDVIHAWKAEKLNTDSLLRYFTEDLGAKYFMAQAHHHDNFDNWNSTYQPWNSVNVGPKIDVIGEFSKSAKKYGVPFGVSTHDERFFTWDLPAFGSDTSGIYKGVPYDARLTKADGKGKWWEGLDPADLYGIPPEKRTPEWEEEWKKNWQKRVEEVLTKYDVDFMWFDGRGFPYGDYGKEVFRYFYNYKLDKNGKINAFIAGKIPGEKAIVHDVERGVESKIYKDPWESISTFTHWFYKKDMESRHNTRSIIELLVDVVSKNGNYMLNVELLPDGTIPAEHKAILDRFGTWMKLNGEAIYDSKPWKVHGDNLFSCLENINYNKKTVADHEAIDKAKAKAKKSIQFNNRDKYSPAYGHNEVRYTTKGNVLYVIVLNPEEGEIELPSLGLNSIYKPGKIYSAELIGSSENIKFDQNGERFRLNVPAKRPNKYSAVIRVKGAI